MLTSGVRLVLLVPSDGRLGGIPWGGAAHVVRSRSSIWPCGRTSSPSNISILRGLEINPFLDYHTVWNWYGVVKSRGNRCNKAFTRFYNFSFQSRCCLQLLVFLTVEWVHSYFDLNITEGVGAAVVGAFVDNPQAAPAVDWRTSSL